MYIVITSIQEPTKAVLDFAKLSDYKLIVVGDKKSPKTYNAQNVKFLSADNNYGFEIEKVLPYNHYCRKMIGYLYAMENGANVVVETDDDNLPLENFGFPNFCGEFQTIAENSGFVNIYSYFSSQKIWPRGLPLNCLQNKQVELSPNEEMKIGVWQGLADGDPDVDAIYRLTSNKSCYFDKNQKPIVLKKGTVCPFNTQNTAFRKELFTLLYLPSTVTFRFTDILKGIVAQPLMWSMGYNLGFTTATVLQERNVHDYMKDFESEIPCYLESQKAYEAALGAIKFSNLNDNLFSVYEELYKKNIVKKEELPILEAWIKDCANLLGV